jgi:hypothetical protein
MFNDVFPKSTAVEVMVVNPAYDHKKERKKKKKKRRNKGPAREAGVNSQKEE